MPARKVRSFSAFTLIELLIVIVIIALLIAILLPALAKARKAAKTAICISNMGQMGRGLLNYSADWRGAMCQFSWKKNISYSQWADLGPQTDDGQAHNNQCTDIVRRITGGTAADYPAQPPIGSGARMVDRNFGHVAAIGAGYFGETLPVGATACPEDFNTNVWQKYRGNYQGGLAVTGDPDPASAAAYKAMYPFWCTYQFVPTAWTDDTSQYSITQASGSQGAHMLYQVYPGLTPFNTRRQDDVLFPSQKVWMFDLFDRHRYRRDIWHAYPIAAQPLLFFDGAVSVRRTGYSTTTARDPRGSNLGWNPSAPNGGPTRYTYYPFPYEPATLSGAASDTVYGMFRWTRAGLKGVDYNGNEQRRW